MDIKILRDANPWWKNDDWEEHDKTIKEYNSQKIKWIPKWINDISLKPFSLNFVIGPRQVGKTTGIKLLIKKLIDEGTSSEDIVYVDCEIFPNFVSLRETIENYLSMMESKSTKYLFLDEVTSVREWWRAIKYLIDIGKLEDCVVTITGSCSLKIKRDIEMFPGRTGYGRVIEVLPLNFREYIEVFGIKNYKLEYDSVLNLFKRYLETGGFPLTINDYPSTHILNAIVGEMIRFGKSLEVMKETIASLISKIPSALSFRAIASETSGYSYKTVQEYLEFLRDLYIIDFAYLKEGNKVLFRKERKIFFRDPLLLKIFSDWTNTRYLYSALIENVIQEHLYRKFGEIYYYKNSYEIDCIAGDLKVEVKAGKPHRKYPRNVLILGEEDVPKFLVELFK
jgi:predicted AAA+ superfamily ATPase